MSAACIKPILICYDDSAGARHAVEVAGQLFPGQRAIVLHVWSPVTASAALAIPGYDIDALQIAAGKVAEAGCVLANRTGLKAQPEITEVSFRSTWRAILDIAAYYDATLVVLGARGLSTFKSVILGSVSRGVAQHAHLPVLIVPRVGVQEGSPGKTVAHVATMA